jgi:predicted RNA-binding protein Jag
MGFLENKYSFKLVSKRSFSNSKKTVADRIKKTDHEIDDSNKRSFLKILGVAGVGIAASQLIPSKAEALIMGGTPSTSTIGVKNASNVKINPATEETLATLATETTLGTRASETTLATRASETTLAAIKTNSDKFIFDIDGKLLTASTGESSASIVGLKDTNSVQINPVSEESILYLRRMVKMMESQAVVDNQMRQRVVAEQATAANLNATVTQATAANLNATVTGTLAAVTTLNQIAGVDARWQILDWSRQAYNSGIRANLVNS